MSLVLTMSLMIYLVYAMTLDINYEFNLIIVDKNYIFMFTIVN